MKSITAESYYTPSKLREKISTEVATGQELALDVSRLNGGYGFDIKNISDCLTGKGFFMESEIPQNRGRKRIKESIVDRFHGFGNDQREYVLSSKGTRTTNLVIDVQKFGQDRTFKLLESLGKEGASIDKLTISNLNLNTPKKSERFAKALSGLNGLDSLELFSQRSNEKSIESFLNSLSKNSSITDVYMTAREARYVHDPMSYLSKKTPLHSVRQVMQEPNYASDYYFSSADIPPGTRPSIIPDDLREKIASTTHNNYIQKSGLQKRIDAGAKSLQELALVSLEQQMEMVGSVSHRARQEVTAALENGKLDTNENPKTKRCFDKHVDRLQTALENSRWSNNVGR